LPYLFEHWVIGVYPEFGIWRLEFFLWLMDYPRLRAVNIFPVEMSGQSMLCLQDPLNIGEKALFLPPPLYFIVSLFDGRHSIVDIQAEFMRRYREFLFTEKVQEIIGQLEENLFLEGDRFEEALRQKEDLFKKSPIREAAFAGKSYVSDPESLRAQIEGFFKGEDGPGLPEGSREGGRLKGVVSPHIDFQRGGPCYAFAHREVQEKSSPDCFIILGTAHTPMDHPFCITRKDFVTPLGTVAAYQPLIDAIQSRCSYDLSHDEGAHRSEHSIEFQCILLRFMRPEPAPLKIVPILSGSFQGAIEKGISPMEVGPIRQFIEALKESVSSLGQSVCYIASADLAHMGLQFGDREGVQAYDLRTVEEVDREMLGYVERMDPEGFYGSILKDRDQRKICGLPSIYTMLYALGAKEGRLLKYGQAFTPEAQSVVSFASLGFY
jgi:MEMO1 family protein